MKIFTFKGLAIISLLFIIFLIIYFKVPKQDQTIEQNLEITEKDFINSNIIKDINTPQRI